MARINIDDLRYGAKYHDYFWNTEYNPNATVRNGLANCTTLVVGLTYAFELPYPVSSIPNANNFHANLINGWKYTNFDKSKLKVGDIIEWTSNCHVCTVADIIDGVIYVHSSWYTGEHGRSTWDGKFDTRYSIHSLKELSDFMFNNYPYRTYHYTDLDTECQQVGGDPQYICIAPSQIKPDGEDKTRNQINILTNEQNVRNAPNGSVIGVALSGFYNVLGHAESGGYIWWETEYGYVAEVKGRVVYVPQSEDDYSALVRENKELKKRLDKIKEIANYE
jgi:hypothetical protein